MNESASAPASTPTDAAKKPLKLPDLSIEGFRGFERFHFPKLTRVNLLVGPNNSGKTTVLEAVEMLAASDPAAIFSGLQRRQELRTEPAPAIDYQALFHGFETKVGNGFGIEATGWPPFRCSIVRPSGDFLSISKPSLGGDLEFETQNGARRRLRPEPIGLMAISAEGTLKPPPILEPLFVSAAGGPPALGPLWDRVARDPEVERWVVDALKIIHDGVIDLRHSEGRFYVGVKGAKNRIPLSSMGDGMSKILALALHLAAASDNVLLIDEIDTGLYYRTLPNVWKLVIETARQLNVQVFATTHSRDCVEALANLDLEPDFDGSDLLVHRIDPGATRAVTYNLERLVLAVSHDIEVR